MRKRRALTRYGLCQEQGQSLVMVAISLVALIGIIGLAIDVGLVMSARRQLARLTDSAALAAASALSGLPSESDGLRHARAEDRATEYVRMHGLDPSAPGCSLRVSFPTTSPARKLVEVQTSRPVPLSFMRIFGISEWIVSSLATQGESPPIDIVLVQDVSISQLISTHAMNDPDGLVNPAFPLESRDPSVPSAWYSPTYEYRPFEPTTIYSWPPHSGSPRTNVPWQPFATQQAAAHYFIDQLDPRFDQVAIVSFSTAASDGHLPSGMNSYSSPARVHQTLTSNFAAAHAAVGYSPMTPGQVGTKGLFPLGGTAMAAGIRVGLNTLTTFPPARKDAIAAMILLTDGSATNRLNGSRPSGCFSHDLPLCRPCREDVLAEARVAAEKGVVIYTIFVGDETWEHDNALLLQYASDLTDNRRLDGVYEGGGHQLLATGGPAYEANWFRENICANYYRANSYAELEAAYRSIFQTIYTRLAK